MLLCPKSFAGPFELGYDPLAFFTGIKNIPERGKLGCTIEQTVRLLL